MTPASRGSILVIRADELRPDDRLALRGGALASSCGGDTVLGITTGHDELDPGLEVVFVSTTRQPSTAWPLTPAAPVGIDSAEVSR